MSYTFSAHSASAALLAGDEAVGKKIPWQPQNPLALRFFSEFHEPCLLDIPGIPEITRFASTKAADINQDSIGKPLKDVEPGPLSIPLYVKGRLDVLVNWLDEGHPEGITWTRERDNFEFPAVKMGDGGIFFYGADDFTNTIVRLATKSGYEVYLTVADEELSGLDLLAKTAYLQSNLSRPPRPHSGVRFPMVSLKQSADISFFEGVSAPLGSTHLMPQEDSTITIAEAAQENILRMDEVGARVVSETTFRMTVYGSFGGNMPPPPLVIEEPFYFWLVKPGCKIPLFAAYVTEEDWKKPSSLTDLSKVD